MSVLATVKELLQSADSTGQNSHAGEQSKGAYWCHDCDERVPDVKVANDETPACPNCGDEMEFERSPSSAGCAC